ncbi:hypothetical protein ELQ88_19170 [Pseudomonas sp. MPC6]|nr:hypothetical protein ELQ88_19170 [Pseudomonas sp. MPC6]
MVFEPNIDRSINTGPIIVGASLLVMVVNDNAGNLTPRGALWFIASKLAPTGARVCARTQNGSHH